MRNYGGRPSGDTIIPGDVVLDVHDVTVAYEGRTVLDRVNLTVRKGAFVGVIGSNGAGKTTLLKVILGLVEPLAGTVRILGLSPRRGSRLVGYVPQSVALDADLPVRARDIVALGLDGHRWGFPLGGRARRRKVDAMLERVGALAYADEPVGVLSGGERQRLLVAQALLTEPRLLLLDEPLANLDLGSTQDIVELVYEIAHRDEVAVLLVAHDMNPLMGHMDQVVYLASGRAVTGTPDEVVEPAVLSRLYGHPVEVLRVHGRVIVLAGTGPSADEAEAHGHGDRRGRGGA
jgi:zinc/manganese transport system ATP-binding protein